MGARSVLLYNLGAVQEFVAQARRTQDLWMGSFLISWLTWQTMKPILRRYGPQAILMPSITDHPLLKCNPPDPKDQQPVTLDDVLRANLPNVFSAIVRTADLDELGQEIDESLAGAADALASWIHERVSSVFPPAAGDGDLWQHQWRGLIERLGSFWAACDIPDSDGTAIKPDDWAELVALAGATGLPEASVTGNRYGIAARAASAARGRRKQVRDFSLSVADSAGSRCTQCGLRGSVRPFYKDLESGLVIPPAGSPKVKLRARLRAGDELCAVCLGKRLCWEQFFLDKFKLGGDPKNHLLFPSTRTIATAPFKAAVVENWEQLVEGQEDAPPAPLKDSVREYAKEVRKLAEPSVDSDEKLHPSPLLPALRARLDAAPVAEQAAVEEFLRLDGAYLFEEELTTLLPVEPTPDTPPTPELVRATEALRGLRSAAAKAGIADPPAAYYAVIVADGDKVGEWISLGMQDFQLGVRSELLDGGDLPTKRYHRALGSAMENFAAEATAIAHGSMARCVFAGGDDVLILASLSDALPIATALNSAYSSSRRKAFLKADPESARKASLSAAILIVHSGESLSESIRTANTLLKEEAKKIGKRASLCIGRQVRGSAPLAVTLPWGPTADVIGPFSALVNDFRGRRLSPSLNRDLDRLEPAFARGVPPGSKAGMLDAWEQGTGSIIARTAQERQLYYLVDRHAAKGQCGVVYAHLLPLLTAWEWAPDGRGAWPVLARATRIAQFLAREQ